MFICVQEKKDRVSHINSRIPGEIGGKRGVFLSGSYSFFYQVVADGVNGRADVPCLGQGHGVGGDKVDDGSVVGTIGLSDRDDNGAFFFFFAQAGKTIQDKKRMG